MKVPYSPFTTHLSGSARETELRIRNIFQWKKKRPPVIVLIAAVLVIVFCGSLVSFTTRTPNYDLIPDDVTVMDVVDLSGSLVYADERNGSEFDLYWLVEGQEPDLLCRFGHWGSPNVRLEKVSLGEHTYLFVRHDGHYPDVPFWNYKKFTDIFYVPQDGAPLYTLQIEGNFRLEDVTDDGVKELVHEDEAKCYAAALNGYLLEVDEHGRLLSGAVEEEILERLYNGNFTAGVGHAAALVRKYEGIDLHIKEDTLSVLTKADVSVQDHEKVPEPAAEVEVPLHTEELTGLTLDEHGQGDDSIVLSIYKDGNGSSAGQADARILLGNGKTLTWDCSGNAISFWGVVLRAAYLTSVNHQCIVVESPEFGSTYGAAQYYILEVVNGALKVTDLNDWELLDGFEIALRRDSELSCVRISVSVGTKWNSTGWGTLIWDNGQWSFTEDDYFIDKRTLTVDGGLELTLALRGRNDNYGSGGPLYYDQVQILHGETVLQTITEDSFTPDGHCPFEYFNADAAFHAVLAEDINFDGNTDFGIPCNTTHNDGHVWFLYDPRTRQYRFAFSLAGIPTIDEENKQITEEWWDDSVYIARNTYEFNADGQLSLIDSEII